MIAWTVDLAWRLLQAYPESANPLTEPAVVMVDEIDLHLHPKWQRIIIERLTNLFPATQFIATAHSPLLVQAAAAANLTVLQQEEDHVTITKDPLSIKGWRVDQILTSEYFGVTSARDERIETLINERYSLLDKLKRSPVEEQRLRQIDSELERLPTATTPQDQEAMDVIRRAAAVLDDSGASHS
jgi:predicted ATP-binding protein involved in virulence